MSLMYTEEQKALIALVKEMAENEIKPYVKDADEKGECPKELYKWGFDMGLHMLEVPAEYGGAGLSYETTAMIFEELAKARCRLCHHLCHFFRSIKKRNPGRHQGAGPVFRR